MRAEDNVATIIRVQALIRGFMQRRKYKIRIASYKKTKYFKAEESKETLNGIYSENLPTERRSYTYKTGAVYTGEWKGGMRHGNGTMKWPDGAKYSGSWLFNAAAGQGNFTHADGDTYTGSWVNSKANGKGVY